jgi:hypothetical protein
LHHVFFTLDFTELVNSIDKVLIWDEASLTWVTVTADFHGRALHSVVVTTSSVNRAGSVGNFVLGHPCEGVVGLTTVASLIWSLTRDKDLWGDVDVWPGSLSVDLNSIGKSRSGSMCPARTAVGRYVLVENVGQIVLAIDVVPEHLLWKILNMFKSLCDPGGFSVFVADSAWVLDESIL